MNFCLTAGLTGDVGSIHIDNINISSNAGNLHLCHRQEAAAGGGIWVLGSGISIIIIIICVVEWAVCRMVGLCGPRWRIALLI